MQGYIAETPAATGGDYSGLSAGITDEDIYGLYPGLGMLADRIAGQENNPMKDVLVNKVASLKQALSTDNSVNGRLQTLQDNLQVY